MAKKFQVGNCGSSGAIGTGTTTIAHGCGKAPAAVLITAKDTGSTDAFVNNITATDFDLVHTDGGNTDFYWLALI
jgi:hypothetical protein